jgi:UDP-glucose 4-epimerase
LTGDLETVLVTGASGLLGRHLLGELLSRGHRVVALGGRRPLPMALASACDRVFQGDIRDRRLLREAVEGVDAVCHLAGHIPARLDDVASARPSLEVNALASLALAEEAHRQHVRTLVFASAALAYLPTALPASEDNCLWPVTRATYYLASKTCGEINLQHFGYQSGLRVLALRISSIYGPEMSRGVLPTFLARAIAGEPIIVEHGGRPTTDFVHVADVAHCFVSALHRGEPGPYNVASGESCSLLALAEVIKEVTNSTSRIDVRWAVDDEPVSFSPLAIDRARTILGLRPRPLRTGLLSMVGDAL